MKALLPSSFQLGDPGSVWHALGQLVRSQSHHGIDGDDKR